jgi:parallel beta-helix repeat protein
MKFLMLPFLLLMLMANARSASATMNINNCSALNTANETYVLTQNIINNATSTCILVNASNIIFDCNGRTIDGTDLSGSYGIYAGLNNATIKNCSLTDWWYALALVGNANSTVENFNASSGEYGITMESPSSGNKITNSRLYNNNKDGIRMLAVSSSSVANSELSGNMGNGIYLSSSNGNNLTGLSIYSNTKSGINLSSSDNNTMMSCGIYLNAKHGIGMLSSNGNSMGNMTVTQNQQSGVYLQGSSNNNVTSVNGSRNSVHGFYLYSSSDNNVFSDINGSSNIANGMYMESCSNNRITGCRFSDNVFYGIVAQLSSNNNFTRCDVRNNHDTGVRLYNSDGNYLTDSVAWNSSNYDVYAESSGATNNYFTNTTFSQLNTSIVSSAVIWRKWYLDVDVLDNNSGNPVDNANTTIKDKFNATVFNGLANSSGQIPRQTLTEYNETSAGKNYYTNYLVNATGYGFFGNQSAVNLTSSRVYVLYLQGMGPPAVQVKTYTLALVESDIFRTGRIVRTRAMASSGLGREYLSNSTVTIKDSSGSTVVDSALMTNVSNITNGYVYEYNYTIPGSAEGLWSINVALTDSFARKGYGYKKIAVTPVTLQIKLVLNSTSDSIYIPGTGETAFSGLTAHEYTNSVHYYIASSSNDVLKAVVFSQLNPISMFTEKGPDTYAIGVSQRFSNSMVLIAFSRGRWTTVNNRVSSIERGEFLSASAPSFGFGLGSSYPVKVVLDYSNLGINNTAKIGRGYNLIVIENLGKSAGKANVNVKRG